MFAWEVPREGFPDIWRRLISKNFTLSGELIGGLQTPNITWQTEDEGSQVVVERSQNNASAPKKDL